MTAHYRHLRNIDGSVVCGGEQMQGYPGDDVRGCPKCHRGSAAVETGGADSLVERIRSEANIADRPGQYARLNQIADEVADEVALRASVCGHPSGEVMFGRCIACGQTAGGDEPSEVRAAFRPNA